MHMIRKALPTFFVLTIAAAMAVIGVRLWEVAGFARPTQYFGLIPASCVTWLVLSQFIKGRSFATALLTPA
jgi:membrane protein implicated in regulation of membrane protease activity